MREPTPPAVRGALLVEIDVYICQTAFDGEARDGRRQQLEQEEMEDAKKEIEDAKKEIEDAKKETEQRIEDAKKEIEDAKKEMEQRIEDAKCRMEQAKNRLEVKQQKANVEVAGTSCDGEPLRKKPKLGEADEQVENKQREDAKSDEDEDAENFLDKLYGFDRTDGRD
uniref:Tropomyosin-2 n=1 Tax=Globodera pallida TaxID=36090 RepID=A0A183C3A5_GLOPA